MKNRFKTLLALLLPALLLLGAGCTKKEETTTTTTTTTSSDSAAPAGELKKEDVTVGTGAEAVAGKRVSVNYTGTLTDGKKFDSTEGKAPFTFTLGSTPPQVIAGWEQGILGMKVGGKRKLTIPSQLGYGANGSGSAIPPNATLLFDVELLKVE